MAPDRVRRVARAALAWLCCVVLALTFARAGIDKLSTHGGFADMFLRWGYPAGFRVVVGVVEIAAAGLLLWPRLARWGAIVVIAVMMGALGTRLVHGEARRIPGAEGPPVCLAVVVMMLRWPRASRTVPD